jgi:hypothetical protein
MSKIDVILCFLDHAIDKCIEKHRIRKQKTWSIAQIGKESIKLRGE